MRNVSALLALGLCSCMGFNIIPSIGDSTSSTGGSDATAASDTSDSGGSEAAVGVSCAADPDTGVILCIGSTLCPGLTVDQDLYPGCGFRIHDGSDVIDLECACYGQICPIGVTTTCAQAATLMQDQSQYTVCMQVDQGRCTTN
jgi:hypothetical protein